LASQLGIIRLVLRSSEDSDQPKAREVTSRELMGVSGGGDRAKENPGADSAKRFQQWFEIIQKTMKQTAKAAPAKARPSEDFERFTMRVRTGAGMKTRAEVNDVLLINNAAVQGLPGDE